jgi:hypothetical protein
MNDSRLPEPDEPTSGTAWRVRSHTESEEGEQLRAIDVDKTEDGLLIERRVWFRRLDNDAWELDERLEWHLDAVECEGLYLGLQQLLG